MNTAIRRSLDGLRKSVHSFLDYCHPPARPRAGDDDLDAAMRQITRWPDSAPLLTLDSLVKRLANLEGKKKLTPLWEVYRFVDRRFPRLKLVLNVNDLVKRAHQRLEEAGESNIERLLREAREGASVQAERFVTDLRAFAKDPRKAGREIRWENHERVLFYRNDKRVQLTCGDLPGSVRLRCYARILELLAADLSYEPLRAMAAPLMIWVIQLGNPKFVDMLGDYTAKWVFDYEAKQRGEAAVERKREQNRVRQSRKRKLAALTD